MKINRYFLVCLVISCLCLFFTTACDRVKSDNHTVQVDVKKDDGSEVTCFSIGWKEGKPRVNEFWETSQTIRSWRFMGCYGVEIEFDPDPPYPFEQKDGATCSLDIMHTAKDITIFVETDDEYFGRLLISPQMLDKDSIITVQCSQLEKEEV